MSVMSRNDFSMSRDLIIKRSLIYFASCFSFLCLTYRHGFCYDVSLFDSISMISSNVCYPLARYIFLFLSCI